MTVGCVWETGGFRSAFVTLPEALAVGAAAPSSVPEPIRRPSAVGPVVVPRVRMNANTATSASPATMPALTALRDRFFFLR
ncbi:hypothetical protein GCM10010530_56800 [Kribbella aluminosa]